MGFCERSKAHPFSTVEKPGNFAFIVELKDWIANPYNTTLIQENFNKRDKKKHR
jgi:hypothetical protein